MHHRKLSLAALSVLLLVAVPAAAQVDATLHVNDARLQGTHPGGSLLLYSPDPVELGSSTSHWDTSASPNLLMEPFLTDDLPFLGLDVTPGLMRDVFWSLGSSNVEIFSFDPPGTGFTDPTPFAGAPGNAATTLGEARRNLFNAVLGAWANTLASTVDVDVVVVWTDLFCDPTFGATLGAATTLDLIGLEGSPLPGLTLFHGALAESLLGEDLNGPPQIVDNQLVGGDLLVFMNSAIDDGCLDPDRVWYYGLDGNPPSGGFDTAGTLLHELAHGLGFSNFTNEATGEQVGGLPGVFDLFTFDNTTGKFWDEMTPAERVRSATHVGQVTWEGPFANFDAATTLVPGVPELVIASPAELAGTYTVGTAAFGPAIPAGGLAGEVACQRDGVTDANTLNGCTAATNPAELEGKIALVDRGGCDFTTKVANAQAAGAIAAIVVNNAGNGVFTMTGVDPSITIPSVLVGRGDGNRLRRAACPQAAAIFGGDRFQVSTRWTAPAGPTGTAGPPDVRSGDGQAVMLTDDSGYFWFFNPDNIEVTVKVLDACNVPGFNDFWVFAAGMTDVEVTLTVVDTQSGQSRVYHNPLGTPFQPILDTRAFETCP